MSKTFSLISNVIQIYYGYFILFVILFIILISYYLIRIVLNPDYDLNYILFMILIINILWTLITNKKVRKLTFNNEEGKIHLTIKPVLGRIEECSVRYTELKFLTVENKGLMKFFYGQKEIILQKNERELPRLNRDSGFTVNNLVEIERELNLLRSRQQITEYLQKTGLSVGLKILFNLARPSQILFSLATIAVK